MRRTLFILLLSFAFITISYGQIFNVPTGSFATGTILTGISVALPGEVIDPSPVVFRIDEGFFTPADSIVDMSGCYAHGTAYWADYISRVVIEIKDITCPQGEKTYHIEALGYLYDENGGFGFEGEITRYEKEVWGIRIRTGYATVPAFSRGILFLRQGFNFERKDLKHPRWRRPLTFPENFKDFPP
ncbi:MAG: hypothetical protein NZ927_06465 [Candidatus Calescibacterium sp.]|nr:hypothetical protein [Candidatus Calescibacterium sp.]MCX7734079.1 hypothetical protein [bacterium]MDW8087077.1 TrbI/VirB10 family protein [Candidatus Calescibacterium sp.]